jgi:hypothetical protein
LVEEKQTEQAHHLIEHLRELLRLHPEDLSALAQVEWAAMALQRDLGNLRGSLVHQRRGLDLFHRSDTAGECVNLCFAAVDVLSSGDLPDVRECLTRARGLLAQVPVTISRGLVPWVGGLLALCEGNSHEALRLLQEAHRWLTTGVFPVGPFPFVSRVSLARAHLTCGTGAEALRLFKESLAEGPEVPLFGPSWTFNAFSGIEEAAGRVAELHAVVEHLRRSYPESRLVPIVPSLEAAEVLNAGVGVGTRRLAGRLPPGWTWHDPFGDCSYGLDDALCIRAANGRDLWHVNRSAPRFLQPAPSGDYAVQTVCTVASAEQPAIGGLLLWQNEQNYLVLERGHWGAADMAFKGCLDNQDCILGRGRLPGESVWLRLERQGEQVRALCSADGQQWLTAGAVEFPYREGEQIGVHAIGMIDRTIYHGAFAEGTAIRFESFEMWTDGRDDLTEGSD